MAVNIKIVGRCRYYTLSPQRTVTLQHLPLSKNLFIADREIPLKEDSQVEAGEILISSHYLPKLLSIMEDGFGRISTPEGDLTFAGDDGPHIVLHGNHPADNQLMTLAATGIYGNSRVTLYRDEWKFLYRDLLLWVDAPWRIWETLPQGFQENPDQIAGTPQEDRSLQQLLFGQR